MIAFAYYLLEVVICSSALFLYYKVALQGKGFHQWNRFYLLAITALSLVIPLLEIPIMQQIFQTSYGPARIVQVMTAADEYVVEIKVTGGQAALSVNQWIGLLYSIVCVVLILIFIRSLLKIRKLIQSHSVQVTGKMKFIETDVPGTPFSFLRYIFWNPAIDLQSETGQQILHHEMVHVQQKHTLDKLFMQSVLIFFWCNPIFWLSRRELNMIHEFIADQKSVGTSGTPALAAMILRVSYPGAFHQLTNPFFKSSIKRRLTMLTKNHNPRFRYLTRVMALPVLVLVSLVFACRTKDAPLQTNNENVTQRLQNATSSASAATKNADPDNLVFVKAEVPPQFPGGNKAWANFLSKNVNALVPIDNGAPEGTYKVEFQFIVHEDGKLSSFTALTSHGYGMEEEVLRILKLSPNWSPAIQNGHNVAGYHTQPVTFVVASE